ncbi:hypothetical protein ACLMJK_002778 [Lecanora helva]
MSSAPTQDEKDKQQQQYDVSPLTSDADSDSDNDLAIKNARTSTEIAQYDDELLQEEEERENLLTNGTNQEKQRGFFGKRAKDKSSRKDTGQDERRKPRRSRRRREKASSGRHDEEGELMYEMEEGGPTSEISSQASSSSTELDKMKPLHSSKSKRRRLALWHMVAISIAALFALLTFGAYKVTRSTKSLNIVSSLSNGTATFAPTTILISLDGFRADFLRRGITPTLNQFIAEGVSPKYMLPSFPSVTFPNHYTLVTGLYPESHGLVGNRFWDPNLNEDFHVNTGSGEKKWWNAVEPIWATAEQHNVTTAIHMWPGSESGMEFPASFVDKFNGSEVLPRKTERILELLDLPSDKKRPQLIAAYVPVVDADGHTYGPNSTEIWTTISDVDVMLHNLFRGLDERNLTELVNVVVVSDHGMATTSTDRVIQLDDLIDLSLVEHMDGWPLYGLWPKDPIDLRGLYDRLLVEAQSTGKFDVYLRDENMPKRYHFSNNDRIAPLWVVPKVGYAIAHKEDFDVAAAQANGETYHPKGLHGYDHEHPLMRAIFVARGPAFPHKPNSRLEPFQNIEVYNIICDSIGLEPKPNNGTLRLPLKPVGLHSDKPDMQDDNPEDFTSNDSPPKPAETPDASSNPQNSKPTNEELTIIEENKATGELKETTVKMNSFWQYVKAKMAAAQAWAKTVLASLKGNQKNAGDQSKSFDQGNPPP